jgi:hypothetical protein
MPSGKKVVWDDILYVRAYEYSQAGYSELQIAKAFGISKPTLNTWKQERPTLRQAIRLGRTHRTQGRIARFARLMKHRLPPQVQELWLELTRWEREKNPKRFKKLMFESRGNLKVRQTLFIYSLLTNNFNIATSCAMIGISRTAYHKWVDNDPEFAEMLQEVWSAYKDHFRSALIGAVEDGDIQAIIFANKTVNRDYGFGDKVQVEVNGSVDHNHKHIDIEELDLPLDVRKIIYEAMQKKKEQIAMMQTEKLPMKRRHKFSRIIDASVEES